MFTRDTTTPGTSPSSISWSMRANVTVNSYTGPRYYGRGSRLQLSPLRLRDRRDAGRAHDRHGRFPPPPARVVAAIVLPRGRVELADRPRHGPAHRLRAHPDD